MKTFIHDNEFEILTSNKYHLNGREFTYSKSATIEQLEAIGVFDVILPPLEEGNMYINEFELINGRVYQKQAVAPIPPKIFDVFKFKDDVKEIFGTRMFEIDERWGVMSDNLKNPMLPEHFFTIKAFMYGWLNLGKITQDDFNKWVHCFSLQDIDIINYTI